MTRAGTTEQRMAMRARIVLRAAEGAANVTASPTSWACRSRRCCCGAAGSRSGASRAWPTLPHPGRPRTYGREVRERILAETLTPPEGTTHWSTRRLATAGGRQRRRRSAGCGRRERLKPHRVETFKFSTDPDLVAKVTDVVGLYLAPARAGDRAVGGREDPDPGARPDPADAAAAPGPGGAAHPRLQAQRHDQPVRGARGGHRAGDHRGPRAPHRRRLPGLPAAASPGRTRSGQVHVILDNVCTHKTPDVQSVARRATSASTSTSRRPPHPG